MGLAHVVKSADDAALEDEKEVLGSVRMVEPAAQILLGRVIERTVIRELIVHLGVDGALVG